MFYVLGLRVVNSSLWFRLVSYKFRKAYRDASVIYQSKKDTWLILLLILAAMAIIAGSIISYRFTRNFALSLPQLFMVAIVLALVFPLYYQITDTALIIRSGILCWKIPLERIIEVTHSTSPLSSPALSLDRLEVKYWKGSRSRSVLISPGDKESFMGDLALRSPGLERSGNRLLRTGPHQPML